jgi:hypothetical protein
VSNYDVLFLRGEWRVEKAMAMIAGLQQTTRSASDAHTSTATIDRPVVVERPADTLEPMGCRPRAPTRIQ